MSEINSDQPSETAPPAKRKRNLPGMPDPDADVIALSPKTLMATNRFVCEICNKGFQRDQNLQLHRRGHNLPWKLRQRNVNEVVRKRVYICPEIACVHHHPSRALGDLTGIKKHFCRKHGEKVYKCERCNKSYAVQSDRKAHMKTCGMREYRCECGTLFSRRDSFVTHRAFCDALAKDSRLPQRHFQIVDPPPPLFTPPSSTGVLSPVLSIQSSAEPPENQTAHIQPAASPTSTVATASGSSTSTSTGHIRSSNKGVFPTIFNASNPSSSSSYSSLLHTIDPISLSLSSSLYPPPSTNPRPHYATAAQPALSATALLQKAAQMGSTSSTTSFLHGLWAAAPPPSAVDSMTSSHSNKSGLGLGLAAGGSSSGYSELMMSDSAVFGNKPTTLDLLGLGMGGGEGSSGGFSALLNGLDMAGPPSFAGETWEEPSKRKPSLL